MTSKKLGGAAESPPFENGYLQIAVIDDLGNADVQLSWSLA